MLTSMFLLSFALRLQFFSDEFSQYVAYRGHSFMTPRKNILTSFSYRQAWFLGKVRFFQSCEHRQVDKYDLFFSVICKHHYFLEAYLIYSSILETKEVQRPTIRIGSINVCLLSCQFYYTYETCKNCALQQRQSLSLLIHC